MTKYQSVYYTLAQKIESGVYKEEGKLPSERSISEELDVSINTVRKALSLLIENGYINSRHGSGYYISTHKNFNVLKLKSLGTTYKNRNVKSKVLNYNIIRASEIEAENLNVDVGEAIFSVKRLRLIEGKPAILENTIIPVKLFPTLDKTVFEGSFYKYIEEISPYKIDRAIKDISPIVPDKDLANILEVDENKPLLVIENYVYLTTGEQFEYSYNIHVDEKLSLPINAS
ncbi:GntR family transcriptional regulator [Mollicutes bacterium LVI A0039]|nr:GntR family transcriptional regulator [Mollicutes bacterium LVI A0039]